MFKKKPIFSLEITEIKTDVAESKNGMNVKITEPKSQDAFVLDSDVLTLTSKDKKYTVTLDVINIQINGEDDG